MEKRREKRKKLVKYFEVFDRSANQFLGHMSDFTNDGILLFCKNPIQPATRLLMRLRLPDAEDHVDFTGVCLWCAPDPVIFVYDIGFRITDLADGDLDKIDTWLQGAWLEEKD